MIETLNLSSFEVDEGLLKKAGEVVLKEEKAGDKGDLSIALVSKEEIKKLNWEKRGKREATDVLSFNLEPGRDLPQRLVGQVVIAPEVVDERSENNFEKEVVRVLVHGILHILRYNHKRARDGKIMREKEDYYLSKIF